MNLTFKLKRRQLKNWRGIFLAINISKIFEELILNRLRENMENGFSEAADGGRKGRSTLDHLFVCQAVIDYYKYIKCDINLVFLALVKAFDKLCLKSCLLDLVVSLHSSNSYLHPYFILYHFVLSGHTFELWISISNMLFSHRFLSHKGKIWSPVFTGFQKTTATGINIGA